MLNPNNYRKDAPKISGPKLTGFTLIELLVVTSIVSTLSVVLVLNFRSSATNKTARIQTTYAVSSDIRRAEYSTLSGSRFQGNIVCGYGVHYVSPVSYLLYAKAVPNNKPCSDITTRNYKASSDYVVDTKKLINLNMKFGSSFEDIFFESPYPMVYINDDASLNKSPQQIQIQLNGAAACDSQTCTIISVYTSGKLDIN